MTDTPAPALETLSLAELHARRQALISKCRGSPSALSDDDLHEITDIFAILRRRSGGPSRVAPNRKSPGVSRPSAEALMAQLIASSKKPATNGGTP